MSSDITPRKRKASGSDLQTRSSGRKQARGPPTPNPPLVPFPTPPSTRHRSSRVPAPPAPAQPDFSLVASPPSSPLSKPTTPTVLPPHLQTLLRLHNAFNLALSLYIATHPPVLPPHASSATSVELPNLTNLLAIRDTIERTSGRRFTAAELGRLAWLYQWDGTSLPIDKLVSESAKGKSKAEENPFLVTNDSPSTSQIKSSGLSYLITPTRTLDGTGRKVHTYGLGIELELKAGETRQVLMGGGEGGLANRGQGGGMAAIGRWNSGQDGREEVFRERLEKWVELHGGYEPPVRTALPTPQTSGSERSTIPPIPVLPLPHLPQSTLLPSANLFGSPSSSRLDTTATSTPLPTKTGLDDPFVLNDGPKAKVVHKGSVEDRRKAMADRIKARSGKGPTLGSSVGPDALNIMRPQLSAAAQQEVLEKRSTLSRLEGIAEAVWMMFSGPSPGSTTLPTPPRARRKAIPMSEVADIVVKSSKTPISLAEANASLKMLTELCPFFLKIRIVAHREWLEMPAATANIPSPGSMAASSRLLSMTDSSPRGTMTPREPVSPSTESRNASRLPAEPGSPTPGAKSLPLLHPTMSPSRTPVRQIRELAGPASPGKVQRPGGLREVRERIRRALGDE